MDKCGKRTSLETREPLRLLVEFLRLALVAPGVAFFSEEFFLVAVFLSIRIGI